MRNEEFFTYELKTLFCLGFVRSDVLNKKICGGMAATIYELSILRVAVAATATLTQ